MLGWTVGCGFASGGLLVVCGFTYLGGFVVVLMFAGFCCTGCGVGFVVWVGSVD